MTIAAFTTADKEYYIMMSGKVGNMWHTVGYLTANSVVALECRFCGNVALNIVYYMAILIKIFCCL